MKRYLEFPLAGQESAVVVEVEEATEGGPQRASRSPDKPVRMDTTFEAAVEHLRPVVTALISKLRCLGEAVDEVGVEFGVQVGGKWGIIVTSGSIDSNLKVSLKWKPQAAKETASPLPALPRQS
jgi:hypothetical protein